MVSKSDDLILKFRKTNVFFQKMVSISSDLPVLNFKRNHLTLRSETVSVYNSYPFP